MFSTALGQRELDKNDQQIAESIANAVASLGQQLDNFLDISRLDEGVIPVNKSGFMLDALLRSLVFEFGPLAAVHTIEITLNCPEGVEVLSDRILLERIIRNIMSNAVNHNESCSLDLMVTGGEGRWMLTIADTGKGIPTEAQQLIFEEFYQVKGTSANSASGIGLGLSIVSRLNSLLELAMVFESTPGVGTSFQFSLPPLQDSD